MHTNKWFTLGAAAAMLAAGPAVANDGHHHDPAHAHGANAEAGKHAPAAETDLGAVAPKPNYGKKAKGRKVAVTVTSAGFVPAEIKAKKGEVLNLVVTRKADKTCATELVQRDQGVFAPLPLDKPVRVTLRVPKDGPLAFNCAHGHIAGHIVTQ